MRHGWKLRDKCPNKKCKNRDLHFYTFCCSDTADIFCPVCKTTKTIPYWVPAKRKNEYGLKQKMHPIARKAKHLLTCEIGFIGKNQVIDPPLRLL
jgi:hypothetical protein